MLMLGSLMSGLTTLLGATILAVASLSPHGSHASHAQHAPLHAQHAPLAGPARHPRRVPEPPHARESRRPLHVRPLAGATVGIDPGHNGANYTNPSFINHLIFNGRESETCDTTGTQTDAGYTEAQFNFAVATDLGADLRAEGARVVLTRTNNHGVGPCVTGRAAILNHAHANVAVDIHADGGPPGGRGFAILTPVSDGPNNRIITASERFARILRASFLRGTSMPVSSYDGVDGLAPRNDLAGLNLATEPKVLIECGNMRNATDARLLTSSAFQHRAAAAMAAALTSFLG